MKLRDLLPPVCPLLLVLLLSPGGAAWAQRHIVEDDDPLRDPLPMPDRAFAEVDLAQLDLDVTPPALLKDSSPPPALKGSTPPSLPRNMATPPPPPSGTPPSFPKNITAPPLPAPRTLPTSPRNAAATPDVSATPAVTSDAATPVPDAAPAALSTPSGTGNIRLNFQNATLTDVLNSLSASAGFIIVQNTPVTGTINLVSQQPVTAEEAVDALSTVLSDKGFGVIRNGRILKIVPRENAQRLNLPVIKNSDPETIPRKDNMVTQVLPVRYVEVAKLVETLRPLLSDNAVISSNDNSNALILTDTQVNIRRIAEIIRALDTSISGISVIKVYRLTYADAKELADVITQLFSPTQGQNGQNGRNGQQFGGFPNFGGFGGGGQRGGGNNNTPAAANSEARTAASRVVAVADETTNSVVVSAPDEFMGAIADIVERLDTNTTEVTETQIFRLLHADATELAAVLTSLYADSTTANGAGGNNNRGGQQQNRFGPQPPQQASNGSSDRAQLQARVVSVADPRTNSVLVNASHATMAQIALTIGRLDSSDSKKQHVYVHTLGHADPDNVATILRGMYNLTSGSTNGTQPSTSRLSDRTTQGASDAAVSSATNGTSSNSRSGTGR